MAFWAQLLPGLRDARVPLSVGALWLATGYLLWDRLPAPLREGHLVHSLENLAATAPTAAVGSAATFSIYLVGIILNQVGSIVVNKILMPLLKGAAGLAIAVLVVTMAFQSWVSIALIVGLFLLISYTAWRADRDIPFAEHLENLYNMLALRTVLLVTDGWTAVANAWDPARGNVDYILKKEIGRMITESPSLVPDLIERIPARRLAGLAPVLNLKARDIRKAGPDLAPSLRRRSLAKQLQLARSNAEMAAAARRAVATAVTDNETKLDKLLNACLDKRKLRRDIRGRVDRANVQLKANHEGVYGEYDRLRAESELRLALVAPLFALLVAAGLSILRDLGAAKDDAPTAVILAGIVALLMMSSGRQKEAEAAELLYSAVRQELVENHDRVEYGADFFPLRTFPDAELLPRAAAIKSRLRRRWARRTTPDNQATSEQDQASAEPDTSQPDLAP
ncbi:hypothetical protein [Kribbella sp. NPDC048928]|uniref:hypothetical protein n=1 Tax=Kribbella sp. NPDC048928 TaxID=3364111 RepID=UPI00371C3D7C